MQPGNPTAMMDLILEQNNPSTPLHPFTASHLMAPLNGHPTAAQAWTAVGQVHHCHPHFP